MRRKGLAALSLLAVTAAAVFMWLQPRRAATIPPRAALDVTNSSAHAGDIDAPRAFSLIDQHGQPITDETFRGRWLVVFFGFTHCPDFCPTTLFRLGKALENLAQDARDIRVLFITVDPERDTPELLERYLRPLGAKFTGGTGSARQIAAATQAFRTYSRKQPAAAGGSYSVDHSTLLYVLDPRGQLSRQLSSEATPEELAATLRTIVADGS